jgi:high-affinity iron transporter
MLINTVILFLRDALPVFVVMTILLSLLQQQNIKHSWCYVAGVIGLLFSCVLLITIDSIAHALDDTGLEWLYAALYFICYCITLLMVNQTTIKNQLLAAPSIAIIRYCAVALIAIIMALNGASFLIYITGFWHQDNASNALSTGLVLGVGICASIAVLLYFMMEFLQVNFYLIREALLIFFSAGLLMQSSNLLLQIDVLPSSQFLWDSNDIVLESSEVGHLLTVFFGYDATPTLLQLFLYVVAVVIAFILLFIRATSPVDNIKNSKEAVS